MVSVLRIVDLLRSLEESSAAHGIDFAKEIETARELIAERDGRPRRKKGDDAEAERIRRIIASMHTAEVWGGPFDRVMDEIEKYLAEKLEQVCPGAGKAILAARGEGWDDGA